MTALYVIYNPVTLEHYGSRWMNANEVAMFKRTYADVLAVYDIVLWSEWQLFQGGRNANAIAA